MTPLENAIKLAGSQTTLADLIGTSQQSISVWRKSKVSPDYVLAVAKAVGYRVTPHQLRPDVYPNPDDGLPIDRRKSPTEEARAAE